MTETVRSTDGTTIAFEQAGAGPALIVVAGALSDRAAGVALAAPPRLDLHRHRVRPTRPRRQRRHPAVRRRAGDRGHRGADRARGWVGVRVRPFLGRRALPSRGRGGSRDPEARALRAAVLRRRQPAARASRLHRAPGRAAGGRPPRGCRRVLHDRVGRRAAGGRRRDASGPLVVWSRGARPHDPVRPPGHGRHDERQPGAVAAMGVRVDPDADHGWRRELPVHARLGRRDRGRAAPRGAADAARPGPRRRARGARARSSSSSSCARVRRSPPGPTRARRGSRRRTSRAWRGPSPSRV